MYIETVHKMLFFFIMNKGLNTQQQGEGAEKTLQKKNPSTTTKRQMKACTLE